MMFLRFTKPSQEYQENRDFMDDSQPTTVVPASLEDSKGAKEAMVVEEATR